MSESSFIWKFSRLFRAIRLQAYGSHRVHTHSESRRFLRPGVFSRACGFLVFAVCSVAMVAPLAIAEKVLTSEYFTVYKSDGAQCPKATLRLVVQPGQAVNVHAPDLQEAVGGARAALGFECQDIESITFTVYRDSQPVAVGDSEKANGWEVAIRYAAADAAETIQGVSNDMAGFERVVRELEHARESLGIIPDPLRAAAEGLADRDFADLRGEAGSRLQVDEEDSARAFVGAYHGLLAETTPLPDLLQVSIRQAVQPELDRYWNQLAGHKGEKLNDVGNDFSDIDLVEERAEAFIRNARQHGLPEEHVDSLQDAANDRAQELAVKGVADYRTRISALEADPDNRARLEEEVESFEALEDEIPAKGEYAQAARQRAMEMEASICLQEYESLDLPASLSEKAVRLGGAERPFKQFVCGLAETGHRDFDVDIEEVTEGMWDRLMKRLGFRDRKYRLHELALVDGRTNGKRVLHFDDQPGYTATARYMDYEGGQVRPSDREWAAVAKDLERSTSEMGKPDSDGVTLCDIWASDPADPERVWEGVSTEEIVLPLAKKQCSKAVEINPENGRLHHQLGRVLVVDGSAGQARQRFAEAANLGHAASKMEIALALLKGQEEFEYDELERIERYLSSASSAGIKLAGELQDEVQSAMRSMQPEYTREKFNQPTLVEALANGEFGRLGRDRRHQAAVYYYSMVGGVEHLCPGTLRARERQRIAHTHMRKVMNIDTRQGDMRDVGLDALANIVGTMADPRGAMREAELEYQAEEDARTLSRFYGCENPRLGEFLETGRSIYDAL